jgi:hypothetical protein
MGEKEYMVGWGEARLPCQGIEERRKLEWVDKFLCKKVLQGISKGEASVQYSILIQKKKEGNMPYHLPQTNHRK